MSYINYERNSKIITVNQKIVLPDKRIKYEEIEKEISLTPFPRKKRKQEPKIYYCPFCHLALPMDKSHPCDCWDCKTDDEIKDMWKKIIEDDERKNTEKDEKTVNRIKIEVTDKDEIVREEHRKFASNMIRYKTYF